MEEVLASIGATLQETEAGFLMPPYRAAVKPCINDFLLDAVRRVLCACVCVCGCVWRGGGGVFHLLDGRGRLMPLGLHVCMCVFACACLRACVSVSVCLCLSVRLSVVDVVDVDVVW